MAKRGLKLSTRIPNYNADAMAWRRAIHAAVAAVQTKRTVRYKATDKLEVQIQLHLNGRKLTILDLDNRVKDIFDALHGCIGEKGKSGELARIIPNDNQVYRLVVEKRLPPKANPEALSTLVICSYRAHAGTARAPREYIKHPRSKT